MTDADRVRRELDDLIEQAENAEKFGRLEQAAAARSSFLKDSGRHPTRLAVEPGTVHDELRRELATMAGAVPEFVDAERNNEPLYDARLLGMRIVRPPADSADLFGNPEMEALP